MYSILYILSSEHYLYLEFIAWEIGLLEIALLMKVYLLVCELLREW